MFVAWLWRNRTCLVSVYFIPSMMTAVWVEDLNCCLVNWYKRMMLKTLCYHLVYFVSAVLFCYRRHWAVISFKNYYSSLSTGVFALFFHLRQGQWTTQKTTFLTKFQYHFTSIGILIQWRCISHGWHQTQKSHIMKRKLDITERIYRQ